MRDGKIVQVGDPRTLYDNPKTAFVASFLGGSNVLTDSAIAFELTGKSLASGEAVAIRAEHVQIEQGGPFTAEVVSLQFLGMITEVELRFKGVTLTAKTTAVVPSEERLSFHVLASTVVTNDL